MSAPTSLKAGDPVKMGEPMTKAELTDAWNAKADYLAARRSHFRDEPMGAIGDRQKALDLLSFDRLPATAVPALFAQLREMGVGCRTCKYDSHSGYLYSFCGETDWLGKHFYCGSWEAGE